MNNHKNIHEAQLAVMRDVPYLQKSRSKELSYTFASEAELIHKVRDSMMEHGISVTPIQAVFVNEQVIQSKTGKSGFIVRFVMTYRFAHQPSGTHIDVQTIGEAIDYGDKACAKAMTIGLKYAIRQTFLIETGDDPDIVAANRDADNATWVNEGVKKIDACKSESDLDALLGRMRGSDPKTNEPLFTTDQLAELAMLAERHRRKLRETAA